MFWGLCKNNQDKSSHKEKKAEETFILSAHADLPNKQPSQGDLSRWLVLKERNFLC